ncbi:DUF3370 domain-containing protein [Cyanobium gracile UHCC 0139]|uniref:DUF3370 domain-containing protein n=1 Tax=Cyanobium gracile UHCC 0139 TaxID=3110308 RepID=A0ABU5RTP0_9CYAN|nr:DUF3370 domain-containing protein [Cyanobium gracile]MEA5391114.1 DUF3370 domain-containing protein [Cyanobium gracile UHCC 0139]
MNASIRALVLPALGLVALGGPLLAQPQPAPTPPVLRPGTVAPLPGRLDAVPMVNDNNPEVIKGPGILLSTFDGQRGYDGRPLGVPAAHLNAAVSGPFELFSHHIYAGTPESLDSTLWLAVVAAPRGSVPVKLRTVAGSTALSQSVNPDQPSAPFLPLPALMEQGSTPIWAGPGSRVATELLARQRSPLVPEGWTLPPGQLSTLMVLPLPVRGLDPLLNGLNLQLRLNSDGPVDVATLAAFGPVDRPPDPAVWQRLLQGGLSPKEHSPSPRGAKGPMIYSRVSGVQEGSAWVGRITDPGRTTLSVSRAPISWPIASLERGTLGTGQVQTAPLRAFYPGTAWAAHGNYGVTYDLSLPLRNDTPRPVQLAVALESPIKTDQPLGGLRFNTTPARAVMFRGTVEVSGLDNDAGGPGGRRRFHLVLRAGQEGPRLGTVSLRPGQERQLRVRLIYPADATPPQVLSLIPVATPAAPGAGQGAAPGAAVKQSGAPPASRP